MNRNKFHCKQFSFTAAAAVLCAAFPLHARAQSALDQLAPASGSVAAAAVPKPNSPIIPGIRVLLKCPTSCRFPTSSHSAYGTALDSSYKPDAKYGDYFPYSGETEGSRDESGNPTKVQGLLGGMADESGHPSLFANGGDPKKHWERALKNFRNLQFPDAYSEIGIVCHLTQDQAAPVHAANINHVVTFGDKFESASGKNISMLAKLEGNIQALFIPAMQPYEYYQALQDDTRKHLAEWVNPQTNLPYWPPAADAPPLGQDATKGSWSGYSEDKDSFDKNSAIGKDILDRQMKMAAIYTKEVLKAAAKLIPPAISADALKREDDKSSPVDVTFNVYDNRRGLIKIAVERPLYGQVERSVVSITTDGNTVPSGSLAVTFTTPNPIKGKDIIVITIEDADGNIGTISEKVRYNPPPDYNTGG